jgi:hypothetical protein
MATVPANQQEWLQGAVAPAISESFPERVDSVVGVGSRPIDDHPEYDENSLPEKRNLVAR